MKLIRKPKIAAAVVIITDIIALALAVLLNMIRGSVPAQYHFDDIKVRVEVSHPYDLFGIFTASALVLAAVMTGFIIAAAIAGGKSRMAGRITGASALLVVSAALVLFCHVFVCGFPVRHTSCFVYENENGDMLAIQEKKFFENSGTTEVFRITVPPHEHHEDESGEHDHYEVVYLAATEITQFASDATRYTLGDIDGDLGITFRDGEHYRTLQIRYE